MPGSLFDTNVWIAAVFTTHAFHRQAQQALEETTSAHPAVFCRSTHQGFLRLASTPALLKIYGAETMTNDDAVVVLEALLALTNVCERGEHAGVVALWHRLAARKTASPKIWMDAYLAAFAISGKLCLVTLDHDFKSSAAQGLDLILLNP